MYTKTQQELKKGFASGTKFMGVCRTNCHGILLSRYISVTDIASATTCCLQQPPPWPPPTSSLWPIRTTGYRLTPPPLPPVVRVIDTGNRCRANVLKKKNRTIYSTVPGKYHTTTQQKAKTIKICNSLTATKLRPYRVLRPCLALRNIRVWLHVLKHALLLPQAYTFSP